MTNYNPHPTTATSQDLTSPKINKRPSLPTPTSPPVKNSTKNDCPTNGQAHETTSEMTPHLNSWATYIKSLLPPRPLPSPTPTSPTQTITSQRQRILIRTLRGTIKDLQNQIYTSKTTMASSFRSSFTAILYAKIHAFSPKISSSTLRVNDLLNILSSINIESRL